MFCLGKFVIYISCSGVILPRHFHYIWICIDMCLDNIIVPAFTRLFMLYNIIISCNSSWEFGSVLLLCMDYYSTAMFSHLIFYQHCFEYYIFVSCIKYYLFVIHLCDLVMHLICYSTLAILIDLHPQLLIYTSLFGFTN